MKDIRTASYEETKKVGESFGSILKKGDVVCLSGDLGAGKTAFTGGIAEALGISGHITSPTFTIVNEYGAAVPLYHFDVYRIADPDELFEIGFEEYLYGEGIVVIEWAELIREALPAEHIWVDIRKQLDEGTDTRIIKFEFIGERYQGYEGKMD